MIASACSNLRLSRAFSRFASAKFRRQRVQSRGLGSPLAGRQRTKNSIVTLSTPVRQRRRVQAFPPQDSSDPTNFGGDDRVSAKNTQLHLRRKSPTPWTIQ